MIHHVGRIIPVLAWSVLGDGMVAVLGGVLRGSGHQSMGALLNLCGYWLVGCPLAMLLGFKLRWDVVGFWCGLATATTLQVRGVGPGAWRVGLGQERVEVCWAQWMLGLRYCMFNGAKRQGPCQPLVY